MRIRMQPCFEELARELGRPKASVILTCCHMCVCVYVRVGVCFCHWNSRSAQVLTKEGFRN